MCEQFNFWLSLLIGLTGGLFVWVLTLARKEYVLCRDKKYVFNYLTNFTHASKHWRSAKRIANHTNLTPKRVVFVCAKHKQIVNYIDHKGYLFGIKGLADPEQNPEKQKGSQTER